MTSKIQYGVRPAVQFKQGVPSSDYEIGDGSKVAIIGAFPCVSSSLITAKSSEEAYKLLNITSGVHDEEYVEVNGNLVKNTNYYDGAGAVKQVFKRGMPYSGAKEVLICNITTHKLNSDGSVNCIDDVPQFNTTFTHENSTKYDNKDKLAIALSKLKYEYFDELLIARDLAEECTNTNGTVDTSRVIKILEQLRDFNGISVTRDNFHGMIIPISTPKTSTTNSSTTSTSNILSSLEDDDDDTTTTTTTTTTTSTSTSTVSVVDSIIDTLKTKNINVEQAKEYLSLFADDEYKFCLYSMIFDGEYLENLKYKSNIVETAAFYCGDMANTAVDESMGQKTLQGMTGLSEDLIYDPIYNDYNGTDGFALVKAGATMFECTNRSNNTYACVNSMQPSGYDVSHLRTTAYICKQIKLTPYLCKVNRDTTIDGIDALLATLESSFIDRFPIIQEITHTVQKKSATCVVVNLYINYFGLIIDEVVYVDIGVENNG